MLSRLGQIGRSPRAWTAALLAAAAVAIAACGGDDVDLGSDPAGVVPAEATIYAELVVSPSGDQADDLEEALDKLLPGEPEIDLGRVLVPLLEGDDSALGRAVDYQRDFAPWVGPRAAIFLTELDPEAERGEGAFVLAAEDESAAAQSLDRIATEAGADVRSETHGGVTYQVEVDEEEPSAAAIVDGFFVGGSESGVRDAIDAAAGSSLADDAEFAAEVGEVPDERLLLARADLEALPALIELQDVGLAELGVELEGTALAWGEATSDSLEVTVTGPTRDDASTTASPDLGSLPNDAWLALAVGPLGEQLAAGLEGLEDAPGGIAGLEEATEDIPGLEPGDIEEGLGAVEDAIGLDVRELDWVGETSAFVGGASFLGLGAGIVVEATDERAAADAVESLGEALDRQDALQVTPMATGEGFQAQLRGVPIGFQVELRDGKVIAAGGAASVDDVLSPPSPLSGADRFSDAAEALGEELTPALFVDPSGMLGLIDSLGGIGDIGLGEARHYLEAIEFLIAGGATEGGRSSVRVVLGLQEPDSGSSGGAAAALRP